MAIGFARLEFVKRSSGKNAVAKAAYNSKSRIEFEGGAAIPGRIYDWSRSEKPAFSEIVLPTNVDKKFSDSKTLWNSVEKFEKRKDAQVAHELVLALPDDKNISLDDKIHLAQSFIQKHFVNKGFAVQLDIHQPNLQKGFSEESGEEEKNEKNWHAHVLIPMRTFNESGDSFNAKKIRTIANMKNGIVIGGTNWGKEWTQHQNEFFESKGLDLRVDQSGFFSQIHLGPLRMRGKRAYEILNLHDKREDEFQKFIVKDSTIVLQKLTENKSVFVKTDLEVFLQKNVHEDNRVAIRESFWKNSEVVQLFEKNTHEPTTKFSSIEVVEEERKILRLADRIQQKSGKSSKINLVPENLNDEQRIAFDKILKGDSLACIEGLAGTGKSYLLVALKDHYESNGLRVRAFGPDNATVQVLREKGFKNVSNVHQLLFKNHFSKKNSIESGQEVWIVDESSKLGNRPLLELLKLAEMNSIQVIFSGNSAQLSSVDRGGMFKEFCDRYGHVFLGEIQRQNDPIHRDISKRLAFGDVATAIDLIAKTGGFVWTNSKDEALIKVVEKWASDRLDFPCESSLIIAHTNNEVRRINDLVHAVRVSRGEVSNQEFDCQTVFGNIRVSEGDLIEIRKNSKEPNVMNGQIGVLVKASKNEFVLQSEGKKVSFNPNEFTSFQLAYATTGFRSQGGTIDRTYVVYSQQMNKKLLYVAMSRHVRNTLCFVSKTDASCLMDVKRQLVRQKEAENTTNYITFEEIEKVRTNNQREVVVKELCGSDNLLSKTKGYGIKGWDSLKSGVSSLVEKVQDRISDKSFYDVPVQSKNRGHVVEVKEEMLTLTDIPSKQKMQSSAAQEELPGQKAPNAKSDAFGKLPDDKKQNFNQYFDKSEKASALYAIVQSESKAFSNSKDAAPSFKSWQAACGERNQLAFDLLRNGAQCKAVLGEKGFTILQDRASRHEQTIQPKDSLDNQLNENIDNLLHKLFPEGPQRQDARGFRFGSKGSLLVTCVGEKKGCYYDFENKEGGHLLKLIEKKEGLNHTEAASWAREFLKESSGQPVPSHFSTKHFSKEKDDSWISLMPPANGSTPQLSSLSRYLENNYRLTAMHPYHSSDGDLVYYTLRLEGKDDGKKIVLPLSYGKTHLAGEPSWKLKGHTAKNELLYNAHLLNKHPEKPVLVVEGEKTADAANKLLGKDYVVVSWCGGASAAQGANWKLLSGRDVVIWPDNDNAGARAASEICSSLRHVGIKSLKMISSEALKDLPQKWDLADPLPAGKSSSFVTDSLLRAESKAIGLDRLETLASQHNMTIKQLNEVVCSVEDRLRPDLEKKHGAKTWEIEACILTETTKHLSDKSHQPITSLAPSTEQTIQKDRNGKSLGREYD